jgi:hypothetical protein
MIETADVTAATMRGAAACPASPMVQRPEERRGIRLRREVGAEREDDSAREPVGHAEQQCDRSEPCLGVRHVVREGEHEVAGAEANEPGDRAPEPAEPVHHLAAHVEEGEVDRRRDADDESRGLGRHPDRHRPQRQDDGSTRPDRREQSHTASDAGEHCAVRHDRPEHAVRRGIRFGLACRAHVIGDGCRARQLRRPKHTLGVGQQEQHDDHGEARRHEHPEHDLR